MSSEIKDGFIRQRRNLILSSLTLLFAQVSGLTVEKINVFGNELKLEHAYSITLALWIATIYWLIRYYQYLNGLGDLGINTAYRIRMNYHFPRLALLILKLRKDEAVLPPSTKPKAKISLKVKHHILQAPLLTRNHIRVNLDLTVSISDKGYEAFEARSAKVKVPRWLLYIYSIRSWLYVVASTHRFTEYFLPLIIFLLPVIYFLFMTK